MTHYFLIFLSLAAGFVAAFEFESSKSGVLQKNLASGRVAAGKGAQKAEASGKLTSESLEQVYQSIDPKGKGDPAASVTLLLSGALDEVAVDKENIYQFSLILYTALDEDPEAASEYLIQALADGKFQSLESILPLPAGNSPWFSPLFGAYTAAFSSKWGADGGRLPMNLYRLKGMPAHTVSAAAKVLAEGGPDALRIGAELFPAQIAKDIRTANAALAVTTDGQSRIALLAEALRQNPETGNVLLENCAAPSERALVCLMGLDSRDSVDPGTSIDSRQAAEMLGHITVTAEMYSRADRFDGKSADILKTEIVRKLAEENLVAATRALAADAQPPDEAIYYAATLMVDDVEAATAWANKIQNPDLQTELLGIIERETKSENGHGK